MIQPPLPEDVSKWPADPYALLGVSTETDERELRRAYTRLIRSYKPEHYPEQFRRIRAAYETVLLELSWRGDINNRNDLVEVELVEDADHASSAPKKQTSLDSLDERLESLWQLACDGQEASAYAELVKLVELHPWRESLYLRLYWTLFIAPELDQQRDALDWLLTGLARQTHSQPLRFEYMHRCAETPVIVLRHEIGEWIGGQHNESQCDELLTSRWRAAAKLNRWDRIVADVELMRRNGWANGSNAWLQTLLLASDFLGWAKEPGDQRTCDAWQLEIGAGQENHLPLTEQLDRYESLLVLRGAWLKAVRTTLDQEILALVPICWYGFPGEIRRALQPICQRLTDDVHQGLALMDRFQYFPDVVGYISQSLLWYFYSAPLDELGQLRHGAEVLLATNPTLDYGNLRSHWLRFCLVECVTPSEVAQALDESDLRIRGGIDIAASLHADVSLHCVVHASRIFWD